jgi:hypothetical protein
MLKGIFDLFGGLLNLQKKLDLKKLPSQGVFYQDDFWIKIKKAKTEDIVQYELSFEADNLYQIVESVKDVVRKNIELPINYSLEDIKSVDTVYIFLEIVKFTLNKKIMIQYLDELENKRELEFTSKNFNYFDFSKWERDDETAEILIDGYRFAMPSIGVENCLTFYLLDRLKDKSVDWESKNYDFIFFCGNKNFLTKEEMDNLVTIFNDDLDAKEQEKVKKITEIFMRLVGYTLIDEERKVEVKSRVDLLNIWK